MNKQVAGAALALLFIVVAGLRLIIALNEPSLAFDGYRELRLIEHLKETGLPLTQDPLSFGGRERAYSPLYHYLLLPFTFFFPAIMVLKTLPNILYATSVLLVYFIAYQISNKRSVSLISAILAGFTPIIFAQYLNNANVNTIAVPLFLFAVYTLLRPKKRLYLLIITSILLSFTSPLIFLFIAGIAIFLLLGKIEGLNIFEEYLEILFFLLFFALWTTILVFRPAFSIDGFEVFWSVVPQLQLVQVSETISLVQAVGLIGILPVLFAGIAAHRALFTTRTRSAILVISMAIAALLGLLLNFIPFTTGMLMLTLMLCILAAQGFSILFTYLKQTRAPKTKYALLFVLFFFFCFASMFPALVQALDTAADTPSEEHFLAAEFLAKQNSLTKILSSPHEGYFFAFAAQQAVFFDEEPLLIRNSPELLFDANKMYRSRFVLPALDLLNKHDVTHIVLSPQTSQFFGQGALFYAPHSCIAPVFNKGEITIYEVRCNVKTV